MRCSVFIASSLDGFIARRDGSFDFLDAVQVPGEDYGYAAFFSRVDVLIVGRATYDVVAAMPGDWAWKGKRVVVLTTRPPITKRGDETFFEGDVRALHALLTREGCQQAYVDGGNVISQFLDADLLDELTVSLIPIRLGAGLRLFHDGPERALSLINARSFDSGLVQLQYARRKAS